MNSFQYKIQNFFLSNKIQNSSSLLKPDKEKESSKQYTWISNRQMEEIIFYYLNCHFLISKKKKIFNR